MSVLRCSRRNGSQLATLSAVGSRRLFLLKGRREGGREGGREERRKEIS